MSFNHANTDQLNATAGPPPWGSLLPGLSNVNTQVCTRVRKSSNPEGGYYIVPQSVLRLALVEDTLTFPYNVSGTLMNVTTYFPEVTIAYNTTAIHSLPIGVNMLSNSLLYQTLLSAGATSGKSPRIDVTSNQLPFNTRSEFWDALIKNGIAQVLASPFVLVASLVCLLILAFAGAEVVSDREVPYTTVYTTLLLCTRTWLSSIRQCVIATISLQCSMLIFECCARTRAVRRDVPAAAERRARDRLLAGALPVRPAAVPDHDGAATVPDPAAVDSGVPIPLLPLPLPTPVPSRPDVSLLATHSTLFILTNCAPQLYALDSEGARGLLIIGAVLSALQCILLVYVTSFMFQRAGNALLFYVLGLLVVRDALLRSAHYCSPSLDSSTVSCYISCHVMSRHMSSCRQWFTSCSGSSTF